MPFMNYPDPGICRRCKDPARSANSFICNECARVNNNERMQRRYEENLRNGYTVNGTTRKRKYYSKKGNIQQHAS